MKMTCLSSAPFRRILLTALLSAPSLAAAADPDELTRGLRAKTDERRSGPSVPAMKEGATLPPDVEVKLREALRQKMAELEASEAPVEKPHGVVARRPVGEKAGMNMAPRPNPNIVHLPVGTVTSVPTLAASATPAAASSDPLKALDEQYRSGLITPRAYHEQRAKLTHKR